ncbi:MAG: hypothetical protein SCH98_05650 [Deferrisomatales bacterium]|nr:hypothetical protein [Deferrisomatales bacterium]
MAYDPFDPENTPVNCPSCQKGASARKLLRPVGPEERRCSHCGRVERWGEPDPAVHGQRRYKRLVSRQRSKFGDLGLVLKQWIAEPEAILGDSARES